MNRLKKQISTAVLNFNPLCLAISLSMLMLAVIIALKGGVMYNADTPSYIEAWNDCYSHGDLDTSRTPVYPVIIGLGRILFGSKLCLLFPVLIQIVVFYSCGILFSKMILGVISNRRVAWFTIFLYFLFYPIVNTLTLLGTESLAFSLTALWMWCVWKFMQRATFGIGLAIVLITITEIMLRPSLLILAMALGLLALTGVFISKYRRRALWLFVILIPVGGVLKAYIDEMERRTEIPTLSLVSMVNTYYMAREFNDIFPELLTDTPEAVAVMQKYHKDGHRLSEKYIYTQYLELDALLEGVMTYRQIQDYADNVKHEHPGLWYGHTLRRIADSLTMQGGIKTTCNYLVVTLYTIVFAVAWIRLRRFSLVNFLILMIGGGSVLSVLLYAQNDFGRLILPTSAALILMGGQLLNCLRRHPLRLRLSNFYPATQDSK